MHIIPAVDIKDGKAVRLLQGDMKKETVYSDSPVEMAKRWRDQGATYLHVVDLDGAVEGQSGNEKHVEAIVQALDIPVEVGGGVRTLEKAQRLVDFGVERVIIGTKAVESPDLLTELLQALPGRVNVGVDARNGYVAVKGWTETTEVRAEEFIKDLAGQGVAAIIYTDISRDGALTGANVYAMTRATQISEVPIIASGGVTTLEDIRVLRDLPLFGIIVGKALYDERFTLQEAMKLLRVR